MKLIVACSRAGLIRGGQRNPSFAFYEIDHFTGAQLRELIEEPSISLAIGLPITPAVLDAYDALPERGLGYALVDALGGYVMPAAGVQTVVDQGAPSIVQPGPAAAVTGADLLKRDLIPPAHSGAQIDPPIAGAEVREPLETQTVERMHTEEVEMAAAKGGRTHRGSRV